MAKSDTTNVTYYFARRKDTGMAGVWFTHCASDIDKKQIVRRLIVRAVNMQEPIVINSDDMLDTRFRVCFLEKFFVGEVRKFCHSWNISIALDLHLQVLREAGHDIKKMP